MTTSSYNILSRIRVLTQRLKTWVFNFPGGPSRVDSLTPLPASLSREERFEVLTEEYKFLKYAFWRDQAVEIPHLRQAEEHIAHKHGVDPLFLNWYVVCGSDWPPLETRTRQALRTIQDIYFWHAALPPDWEGMETPSDLERAHAALVELGEFFLESTLKTLCYKWQRALKARSERLVLLYARPGEKTNAALELWLDFRGRLISDRFQGRSALIQTVYLL
jgi:hypothetical protein